MTDISERQTIEYFVNGLKKSQSAAKQLATLNQRSEWNRIASTLDVLLMNAKKLYEGKPQTRLQTLALANKIQADEEKKVLN